MQASSLAITLHEVAVMDGNDDGDHHEEQRSDEAPNEGQAAHRPIRPTLGRRKILLRPFAQCAAEGAGGGNGLNIPPGTADATGLSDPSAATEDAPNTQSSTRTWGNLLTH